MQHLLLDCPLYEEHHQHLQNNLVLHLGINYLDLPLFRYEENEEHVNWRETILKELGDYMYIRNAGRLHLHLSMLCWAPLKHTHTVKLLRMAPQSSRYQITIL